MNDLQQGQQGAPHARDHHGSHGKNGMDLLPLDDLIAGDNALGDILVAQGAPPKFERLATGAAGTVFIGGSTFSANLLITGYERVGSTTAPTNVTAGDLTAVRILAGNATLATGVVGAFAGSVSATGWTRVGSATAPTNVTSGDITGVRILAGDATLASGVVAAFAGNETTTGWTNIGAATAPSNTTAGDLTAKRAHFGTDGAFTSGKELEVVGDALVSATFEVGTTSHLIGKVTADAGMDVAGDFKHTGANFAVYNHAVAPQATGGENLTNNVTVGGTTGTITNYTDLTTYANDAGFIRNNLYQLARMLKQDHDQLRANGFLT